MTARIVTPQNEPPRELLIILSENQAYHGILFPHLVLKWKVTMSICALAVAPAFA